MVYCVVPYCNSDTRKEKISFREIPNHCDLRQKWLRAISRQGAINGKNTWASAPTTNNLQKLKIVGCQVTHSNEDIIRNCEVIVICVKPFKVHEVLSSLQKSNQWKENHLIISVMSGVTLEFLESCPIQYFPTGTRVIRIMPNTPVVVRSGTVVYSCGTNASREDAALLSQLFSSVGICEEIPENLMDVVCGLSGSGPAYIYTVIQAMSDGAVKMGLPRALSTKFAISLPLFLPPFIYTVIQAMSDGAVKMGLPRALSTKFAAYTVMGAAKMVLETGKHPEVLREEVCSPAGTTICGLHVLEKSGLRAALMDAIEAATNRAQEYSQLSN